ncbi:hypothetical protein E4191_22885 (plasmid) [Paracoccus liaowanqingii]|uniref:Uncharacterized protein n=1 Tax=Paracoccus liaowanqingii TaxID=2560053 RepID=A0A4Y5SU69_9RHOB|nr:hypothetical protein [Paracoccus liaowanqingii]QDA36899.1 hypothetical protein E4191_22885 [Paracoccus liaowanqingii]
MIGTVAVLALSQMIGPGALPATPQALHLCLFPEDPIVNEQVLAEYGILLKDEYDRYFSDLNAYLMCLQRSHADTIERGTVWHNRYKEAFPTNIIE